MSFPPAGKPPPAGCPTDVSCNDSPCQQLATLAGPQPPADCRGHDSCITGHSLRPDHRRSYWRISSASSISSVQLEPREKEFRFLRGLHSWVTVGSPAGLVGFWCQIPNFPSGAVFPGDGKLRLCYQTTPSPRSRGCAPQPHLLPAVTQGSYLTSQTLSLLICRMALIAEAAPESGCEVSRR